MLPYCADAGIRIIPWYPLGAGVLTRKRDVTTNRSKNAAWIASIYIKAREEKDTDVILDQVHAVAEKRGVSAAQITSAWVLSKPVVSSPIVGITKIKHLDDLIEAFDLELTKEEIESLEKYYVPRDTIQYAF